MSPTSPRSRLHLAAALGGLVSCLAPLEAQTLISLAPANVIGGSPVFLTSVYNVGAYAAGNIFNQQSGAVDMSVQAGNAWFPSESVGTTNRFVTIDLGASYVLSSIQIFNSNQVDRGTGSFSLSAGNAITAGANDGGISTGQVVSSATSLLGATALTYSTFNPVSGQTFALNDGNAYRYLTLVLIGVPSTGGPFANVGLAEVRLFGSAIPEPSTYAALFGASALGFAFWRRRRGRFTARDGS